MRQEDDSDPSTTHYLSSRSYSETSCTGTSQSSGCSIDSLKNGLLPMKHLSVISEILKHLIGDDEILDISTQGNKHINFFCIEDSFLTKDIQINVEGMGQIKFPLQREYIEQLIKLSSKTFFKREKTVLDDRVSDTHIVPADKLTVELNSCSLDDILKRVKSGMNIGNDCQLIPYLNNMLIHQPNEVYNKNTDSEEEDNIIATLVIVLPYPHEGGELIIKHIRKKHMFFGSKNPDIAKCVVFYSNCVHEIKKVTEGYRVALIYNIKLQSPEISEIANNKVNEALDAAVGNYFREEKCKLAFGLNYRYTRKSLRWNLLKGVDRVRVYALLAVAKKQGRIPCLALTTYHATYAKENTSDRPRGSSMLIDETTNIVFMIDEKCSEVKEIDSNEISIREFCCTLNTEDLFRPYESDLLGRTGRGDTEEHWYRRACVVLWSNKWWYPQGFTEALSELHKLTKQQGMQRVLMDEINISRKEMNQLEKCLEPINAKMLIDIVIYLNDKEEAKFILGDLCDYLTEKDNMRHLVQLEKMFDDETWVEIIKVWKVRGGRFRGWNKVIDHAQRFVDRYLELAGANMKSVLVDTALEEGSRRFYLKEDRKIRPSYVYFRIGRETIDIMVNYMKVSAIFEKKSIIEILINQVINTPYPPISLGEVYTKLMDVLDIEHLVAYDIIKDSAQRGISNQLSEMENETGWTLPVKISCKCAICAPIWFFLGSESLQKSPTIEGTRDVYEHLFQVFYCGLNMISMPCIFSHDLDGIYHKMSFEKSPKLLDDRKRYKEDLMKYRAKIEGTEFVSFLKVEHFDESNSNQLNENLESIEPGPSSDVKREVIPKKRHRRL